MPPRVPSGSPSMCPLWLNSRLIGYSVVPGAHVRIADRQRADALRRREIPLEQEWRRLQRGRDVVEAEVRRRRSAAARSRRRRAPAGRESRCRIRCGSSDARRSGPACSAPAHARSSDPASQLVKPTYSASVGCGMPWAASRARSACAARAPTLRRAATGRRHWPTRG